MLLIEALDIDPGTLTDTASWYGLKSTMTARYQPLRGEFDISKESPVVLPTVTEYSALKGQDEVS